MFSFHGLSHFDLRFMVNETIKFVVFLCFVWLSFLVLSNNFHILVLFHLKFEKVGVISHLRANENCF